MLTRQQNHVIGDDCSKDDRWQVFEEQQRLFHGSQMLMFVTNSDLLGCPLLYDSGRILEMENIQMAL